MHLSYTSRYHANIQFIDFINVNYRYITFDSNVIDVHNMCSNCQSNGRNFQRMSATNKQKGSYKTIDENRNRTDCIATIEARKLLAKRFFEKIPFVRVPIAGGETNSRETARNVRWNRFNLQPFWLEFRNYNILSINAAIVQSLSTLLYSYLCTSNQIASIRFTKRNVDSRIIS